MADNVTADPGSGGATFATDDDGTAHHPYVKIEFGANDVQTPVDASNPLPVDLGTNNDVTVTGNAADHAAVSGSPVLMAGRYDITPATRDDGDVTTLQLNSAGELHVDIENATGVSGSAGPAKALSIAGTLATGELQEIQMSNATDGFDATTKGVYVFGPGMVYNGAQFDVLREGSETGSLKVDLGTNNDVVGGQADNAAVTTNPLLVGGRYDATPATRGDGDATAFQTNSTGHLFTVGTQIDNVGLNPNHLFGVVGRYNITPPTRGDGDACALQTDATGTLLVSQQGNVTVDASALDIRALTNADTVTAELSTVDNTVLDNIQTAVEKIDDPVATIGTTPLHRVAIFDAADTQITSFGGGTQYTSGTDTYLEATTKITGAGVVRKDSAASLVNTDNELTMLQVDSSGSLRVTGGGGGTEYVEDAAAAANPTGTALILVREDARAGSLTSLDGDNVALRGNNKGEAYVIDTDANALLGTIDADTSTIAGDTTSIDGKITACNTGAVVISSGTVTAVTDITNTIDSTISGAALTALQLIDDTVYTDDADWTDSTSKHMLVGGLYQSVPQTITDGDVGPLQVDSNGNLITAVTGTVTVDGSAVTQPVSGTVSVTGVATAANQLPDGHNVTIDNASGASAVNIQDGGNNISVDWGGTVPPIGAGTEAAALRVTLATDSTGQVTVDGTVTASNTAGNVAHDGADSGNPVKVGGKAYSMDGTVPGTAVAESDRANFVTDLYGRQYVETTHPNFWHTSADYAVAQTNATVKAAPGAGLKLYITDVIVSNGATAGNITLLDGSGGTVLLELYPAINGGLTHQFRSPLALTANTLLAITSTTVTTHSVTVSGFIAP